MPSNQIGFLILRLAMAGVYLYFGFSQLFDPSAWTGIVPEWATSLSHMSAASLVLGNGILEVVLGSLLALGLLVVPVSVILSIHLFVIALEFGLTPVGVRDFGLAFATLSIAFLSKDRS